MPRYWVIAPLEGKPRKDFENVWQFDLAENVISIGWSDLPNISNMSREELSEAVASTYPTKRPQTRGLIVKMLWFFYHEIAPRDFLIARRGRKTLAAVGRVTQSAAYTPGRNPNTSHVNFLGVAWRQRPRDKRFSTIVFPRWTLDKISEAEYRQFLDDPIPPIKAGKPSAGDTAPAKNRRAGTQLTILSHEGEPEYEFRNRQAITRATKREDKLVHSYQKWLKERGRELVIAKYGKLRCDAYEAARGNLIEAKSSARREYVRMAVGQLFDYAYLGRRRLGRPNLAILLPEKPDRRTIEWLSSLQISVVWRKKDGFQDNAKRLFT